MGGFVRDPDVQVRDISISRLNAMIFYDESGAIGILDLVSKNGTFVNGAEVESKLLKEGDLIALGSTKLRLQ
ncbi:MAG: FHA domain-containing protein [Deltaproteobacteria bacterium]|nr:MAG: FHA domain-containing protein [Deltaproteobacteria bacterium]